MNLVPLHKPVFEAMVEEIPLRVADGTDLHLRRVTTDDRPRPAVLLLHGHTASSDMFLAPGIRNMVEVLLDAGYEPWLLDWRGSCRLPYNETGARFTYDEVAVYDIPGAVEFIRGRIGAQSLYVVAHCIGALTLSMSMTAGLLPGLAGVVAQGVFLTPRMSGLSRLRVALGGELLRSRFDHVPTDFRKVGLWSKYTPLFGAMSRRSDCPDPTCRMLQGNWGMGGALFHHDNIDPRTHDRLADLVGPIPLWIIPHLRRVELAQTMVRWHDADDRFAVLPENALDQASRIDCPVLLLSGSKNEFWRDSNKLCHEVLSAREPQLDVRYVEVPGYGHFDAFIGKGAALDVFGHILQFLDDRR
ncbi:alpha/beta hydrolase [Nocardia sp. NPDC056000]|uniref:alpha/beta hydrolase n=1 Tax=Nocardia sp. NPDC056000 TaxID=3345674 RepID=UPI0035DA3FE4